MIRINSTFQFKKTGEIFDDEENVTYSRSAYL
jgi:hypothetical protein